MSLARKFLLLALLAFPVAAHAQSCFPNPNASGPPYTSNCPLSANGFNYGQLSGFPVQTLSDLNHNSVTVDASKGNIFTLTLTGNDTLAFPINLTPPGVPIPPTPHAVLIFVFTQDGVGGRTLTFASGYKKVLGGNYTLSAGAGQVDIMSCLVVGSTVYCLPLNANLQ